MPLSFNNMLDWWLSPLSGSDTHAPDNWLVWHARTMVLAWAVLLPLGVLAARYFKVTPGQDWPQEVDSRAWWHAHRLLQYGGVALMLVGTALAWNKGTSQSSIAAWHTYLGWSIVVLGVVQVISAWLRGSKGGPTESQLRGDHYDMTPYRLWFERLHKSLGWTAVLAAIVTVALGLLAADAPRWMALALLLWWLALFVCGAYLQRAGRAIDTYQAIWGPDENHPGNQRTAIGWGMRRPLNNRKKV